MRISSGKPSSLSSWLMLWLTALGVTFNSAAACASVPRSTTLLKTSYEKLPVIFFLPFHREAEVTALVTSARQIPSHQSPSVFVLFSMNNIQLNLK
ncbi:hypothetical protein ABQ285_06850 [Lacticaseibacillus casei]